MRVYIWKYQEKMSSNYHSEGGAVAVARDLEHARELILKSDNMWRDEGDVLAWETKDPDISLEVSDDADPFGALFPDAGCC